MERVTFFEGQNLPVMHAEQKISIPPLKMSCLERKRAKLNEVYLPPEIIFEILSRLPVKSLLAFKCVCKLWCSVIEEHQFIELHRRRARTVYVYKENLNEWKCYVVKHGLLLERNRITHKYILRNPATKTMLDLPSPNHKLKVARLIYLQATDNFKLVNVYGKKGSRFGGCEVLTVGKDLSWRTLDIPNLYYLNRKLMDRSSSVCINEVFYFMRLSEAGTVAHEIVCLEMKTESFETVKVPKAFFSSWDNVVPISWDTKFSVSKVVEQELHVWALKDYTERKWAERKMTISLSFLNDSPNLSVKLVPRSFRNGWLYFRRHKDHKVAYHVESGKARIKKYTPCGGNIAYTMQHTLVNPLGAITSRTRKGSRFTFGWVVPVSFTLLALGLNLFHLRSR